MNVAPLVAAVPAAGTWYALVGRTGWPELGWGLLAIASAWWLFARALDAPPRLPLARAWPWLRGATLFTVVYILPEIVSATARTFVKAFAPYPRLQPVILAVELPEASPVALTMLAYGISLSPDQMVVDLVGQVLYIQCLDAPDPELMRARVQRVYQRFLVDIR